MIKSFKLFESIEDDVTHYLGMIGTTTQEVKEIFDDVLMMSEDFSIDFKMNYKSSSGHNVNRWSQEKIPILIIRLKCQSSYDSPEFISGLSQAIGYFYKMSDDIKIYYNFSESNFFIKCKFPIEMDKDVPSLEDVKKVLSDTIKQTCSILSKSKPDNLEILTTKTYIELHDEGGVFSKWVNIYNHRFLELFGNNLNNLSLSLIKMNGNDFDIKYGDRALFQFSNGFIYVGTGIRVDDKYRSVTVRCDYRLDNRRG